MDIQKLINESKLKQVTKGPWHWEEIKAIWMGWNICIKRDLTLGLHRDYVRCRKIYMRTKDYAEKKKRALTDKDFKILAEQFNRRD